MGWASLAGAAVLLLGLKSPSSPTSGADAELWSWAKTFRLMKRKDMSNLSLGLKHFLELSLNKVWNSWTGNKLIMGFYNMHFPYKALKCSIGFMGLVADLLPILMKILGFFPVCVVMCVRSFLPSRLKCFISPLSSVVPGWTIPRPDQGREPLTIPSCCLLFLSGSYFL